MFYKRESLLRRVAKLEKLVYERSVGRGGPSIAMNMWQFLMDHGPSTREEIESGLGPRYSNTPTINSYLNAGLITQRGNRYIANPNYSWDDVGVIPRTSAQELTNLVNSDDIETVDDDVQETPAATTRSRGRRNTNTPIKATRTPRAREVKQNLFSRKYDEVKAAIDAGQDCTVPNDKGITPIMHACKDPKGESGPIVELLLDHGADVNSIDHNKHIIFNAIKYSNFGAINALVDHRVNLRASLKNQMPIDYALEVCELNDSSMETISRLTDSTISGMGNTFFGAIYALNNKGLSHKWYNTLINKTYASNRDMIENLTSSRAINAELKSGVSALYDLYTNTFKRMPPFNPDIYGIQSGSFAYNKLYKSLEDVVAGKIKPYSVDYLLDTYAFIGREIDGIFNFVTIDYLRDEANSSRGVDNIISIIRYAIRNNDISLLQTIAKAKLTKLDGNKIISLVVGYAKGNKAIVSTMLHIAGNCSNIRNEISDSSAVNIAKSTVEYLIDWAIDRGYGQQLVDAQLHMSSMSSYCANALKEAGFSIDSITPLKDRESRAEYTYMRDYIIRLIERDEWNPRVNTYLNNNPQILSDEEILDAIKDNPDSVTANQLQRRIDALPKDPKKYDF